MLADAKAKLSTFTAFVSSLEAALATGLLGQRGEYSGPKL